MTADPVMVHTVGTSENTAIPIIVANKSLAYSTGATATASAAFIPWMWAHCITDMRPPINMMTAISFQVGVTQKYNAGPAIMVVTKHD